MSGNAKTLKKITKIKEDTTKMNFNSFPFQFMFLIFKANKGNSMTINIENKAISNRIGQALLNAF